jgi:rhomboid protease GluP
MSDIGSDPWAQVTSVYLPRRKTLGRAIIVLLVVAVGLGWPPLEALRADRPLDFSVLAMLLGALMLLGFAVLSLIGAIRGLPRLDVSAGGVRLASVFSNKWASWGSLGPFEVARQSVALGQKVQTASARVIGPEVSRNLRTRQRFFIPNAFQTPLTALVTELNADHAAMQEALAVTAAVPEPMFGIAGRARPWLTCAMLLGLIAVFVAEQFFAVTPPGRLSSASLLTLRALGGLNRVAVIDHGEWYRIVTAPLLHADITHLIGNGIALLLAGLTLERLVGRAWYFALFVLGGVGGSLMSLMVNAPDLVSVGASGAIMAMFAAIVVTSYRLPEGPVRSRAVGRSVRVLIPSLLPMAANAGTLRIDYGAHIGGALAGAAIGPILLKCWPQTSRLPALRPLAGSVAVAGVVLWLVGAGSVAAHYPAYRAAASLIPPDQMPRTDAEWARQAVDLAARYPQDPRLHIYLGTARESAHDFAGAIRELQTALIQA